jgi:hypothetical protein
MAKSEFDVLAMHFRKNASAAKKVILEKLDENGRCPICKVKPLTYKREGKKYCFRCSRTFNFVTGTEIIDLTFGVRPGARFKK